MTEYATIESGMIGNDLDSDICGEFADCMMLMSWPERELMNVATIDDVDVLLALAEEAGVVVLDVDVAYETHRVDGALRWKVADRPLPAPKEDDDGEVDA